MRWLTGSFGRRTWRCLLYLSVGLVTTPAGFAVGLGVLVVGPLAGLTVVGLRVVPWLLVPVRAMAAVERWRTGLLGPVRPPRPYWPVHGLDRATRTRAQLRDPATWRDLAWLWLAFPGNLAGAVWSLAWGAVGLGLVSLPIWYRLVPGGQAKLYDSGGVNYGVVDSIGSALPYALLGLVVLWLAGWQTRAVAVGQAAVAGWLLGPARTAGLEARVAALSATRAAAVDGQQRELRRIERDLHDGAQARLVALSVDLGLAEESFDADPAQARQLLAVARDQADRTLADLRELVRGIGPPILADRGLSAALDAVAARGSVPVALDIDLPDRLPPAVELAAYFVVCECLANAAKHSGARRATVTVRRTARTCRLEVTDDGVGGADPAGGGLSGLADRVAALDGVFTVDSPAGGPTAVRAELPCAS
jgi:signal transduction histidine kinase